MQLTQEQRRQKSGRDMEEARRASGRAMRDDMRALAESNRPSKTLPPIPVRGSHPERRGRADWSGVASSAGTGGGIASPLTEEPGTREYHWFSPETVIPLDGFFFYRVRSIKALHLKDANGDDVAINLERPTFTEAP